MANVKKSDALVADSSGDAMLGARQALVADPDALTSADIAFTWTANDPGVTDGTATIDDGATVGDDNDAGDALSALEDQFNKLRADLTSVRTQLIAALDVLEAHGLMSDS